jgi:hypothetical protein
MAGRPDQDRSRGTVGLGKSAPFISHHGKARMRRRLAVDDRHHPHQLTALRRQIAARADSAPMSSFGLASSTWSVPAMTLYSRSGKPSPCRASPATSGARSPPFGPSALMLIPRIRRSDTMMFCKMRVPVRAPILFAPSRRCGSLEQLSDEPEQARKSAPGADNAEPQHDPFAHASTATLMNRRLEVLPLATM